VVPRTWQDALWSYKRLPMNRSEQQTDANPRVVLLDLCMGFFMILLDTTIVNIAIPSIIDALRASLDQILWVLNAYILVYAVLLMTAGRLGDIDGQRTLFAAGLALFTLASAFCGLAQDINQLILARVIQGIGGALLTPQTLAMLTTLFPPQRRGAAFGLWGAVAGGRLPPQIPAGVRHRLVGALADTGKGGLEVGRTQQGGMHVPSGVPAPIVHQVQQFFHDVFVQGYLDAMRPTLAVPVIMLLVGALSCLAIQRGRQDAEPGRGYRAVPARADMVAERQR
jgi:nitrate/nitrite transporter NarK